MTISTRIAFVLLIVFMASTCKPIDQQDCVTTKQEPVVLNPAKEMHSQQIHCDRGNDSKIARIQRVFMHSPVNFSFMVEAEEGKRSILLRLRDDVWPEFIWDVPRGEAAYAICKLNENKIELHLYAKEQVEGAGWDHGKQGHGRTIVLPTE